jgi:hypothetical protein
VQKGFQVLKDNGDGTIDVEAPVYTKYTVPHPTDAEGKPLSGKALVLAVQLWLQQNAPSVPFMVDDSAAAFVFKYELDKPLFGDALYAGPDEFPVEYAG